MHFPYKDYADNGKTKIMVLHAHEFIRRFLLHVLPKKFVKIRYYGLLGFKNRTEKITLCRKLLGVTEDICYEKEVPECWKELYEFVTGHGVDRWTRSLVTDFWGGNAPRLLDFKITSYKQFGVSYY